jgi:hypothetical protein
VQSQTSKACKCEGDATAEESVKYSDVVFEGVIISRSVSSNFANYGVVTKGDTASNPFTGLNYPIAVYKVKVNSIFKGKSASDTITILTPVNEAAW